LATTTDRAGLHGWSLVVFVTRKSLTTSWCRPTCHKHAN